MAAKAWRRFRLEHWQRTRVNLKVLSLVKYELFKFGNASVIGMQVEHFHMEPHPGKVQLDKSLSLEKEEKQSKKKKEAEAEGEKENEPG